jgi:tetrahydromethanopterin S-methyltransferase subunit G
MRQYRFTSGDFVPEEQVPDAFLAEDDMRELQRLAGVEPKVESMAGINISKTGMEKQRLEREHNIKPGTPEWFQLWFSLPYFTGEKPVRD